ncbi:MAG: HAMP domain-containing protein [Proteobacteria bacterium]|nr:HAMP domain-containing protein [Pseudomonadota bacterium]MBU1715386.1 HAMP domain-containing protein [Pseudomonadota bacterium]
MKTIKAKLTIYLALFMALLLMQAMFGVFFGYQAKESSQAAKNLNYAAALLSSLSEEVQSIRRYEKEYIIYVTDLKKRQEYYTDWKDKYDLIKQNTVLIIANPKQVWSETEIKQVRGWDQALNDYGRGFIALNSRVTDGLITQSIDANNEIAKAKNSLRILVDGATAEHANKSAQEEQMLDLMNKKFNLALYLIVGTSMLGIFLAVFFMVVIPASISTPIKELARVADKMSKGALDESVVVTQGGQEIVDLAATLERLRIAQRGLLQRLRS